MGDKLKDITPYNDKDQAHGFWKIYCKDKVWHNAYLINDTLVGYEESFHYTKEMELFQLHIDFHINNLDM